MHDFRVMELKYSRCAGKTLATCGGDHKVCLWSQEGGQWILQSTLEHHERTVRRVSWAPHGKWLAACSFDSTVTIWERKEDGNHTSPPV
jgi:WD40 repeat protein